MPREPEDEARVVAEVAPPQAARLLQQAERPLEPEPLQAVRGLALEAGVEVEGGADADEHGRLEAGAHGVHPLLLQRHAEADPDDVGVRGVELGGDLGGLLLGQLAERRVADAGDLEARVAGRQLVAQALERLRAAAVEEEALAGLGGALAGALHQVGAVDAAREVVAEQVHRPHERLAVGDGEVGGEDGLAQLQVLLGLHHRVHRGDADVGALAGRDGGLDPVQRPRVVGQRQRDAEHLLGGEGRHGGARGRRSGGSGHGRGGGRHRHCNESRHGGVRVFAARGGHRPRYPVCGRA